MCGNGPVGDRREIERDEDLRLEQAGNSVRNGKNTGLMRSQRFIGKDGQIEVHW